MDFFFTNPQFVRNLFLNKYLMRKIYLLAEAGLGLWVRPFFAEAPRPATGEGLGLAFRFEPAALTAALATADALLLERRGVVSSTTFPVAFCCAPAELFRFGGILFQMIYLWKCRREHILIIYTAIFLSSHNAITFKPLCVNIIY